MNMKDLQLTILNKGTQPVLLLTISAVVACNEPTANLSQAVVGAASGLCGS
jgi:hypothetical protein